MIRRLSGGASAGICLLYAGQVHASDPSGLWAASGAVIAAMGLGGGVLGSLVVTAVTRSRRARILGAALSFLCSCLAGAFVAWYFFWTV